MTRTAHMLFAIESSEPFRKSSGVINHYIRRSLACSGYDVHEFNRDSRLELPHAEQVLPYHDLSILHNASLAPSPELTLYDDLGLAIRAPARTPHHRNVLFFHGLRGNPGFVTANHAIDVYCTNSAYLARVLRSFMLLPDLTRRTVLDGSGAAAVTFANLPVPLLDYPDGYPGRGETLPDEVTRAIGQGHIIGHSAQRKKACPRALIRIMQNLADLARAHGTRPYRMVISRDLLPELQSALDELPIAEREDAFNAFIAVPLLRNRDLMGLMRASRFALCYHRIPDSFGIYPLESVLLGCPVYTNGIGNNRFLLPQGHGIEVYETEKMAFGDLADFEVLARRIHADVADPPLEALERGRRYIAENYTRARFERDLAAALAHDGRNAPPVEFEDLRIELSPTVRSWSAETRRVISDHRNVVLDERQADLVSSLAGEPAPALVAQEERDHACMLSLFQKGVLALAPGGDR